MPVALGMTAEKLDARTSEEQETNGCTVVRHSYTVSTFYNHYDGAMDSTMEFGRLIAHINIMPKHAFDAINLK
jgi:hypothetical protein